MRKIIDIIIYGIIAAGLIVLCFFTPFSQIWQIIITICLSLTLIGLLLGKFKYKKIYKTLIFILILEAIIICVYIALYYSGLLVHFKDKETLQAWFESLGPIALIIFFLFQLAQVIILPIPAQITTVAGSLAFGALTAFLISTAAIIIGSLLAFGLGKIFGDKIAYKIGDKETVDKYKNVLTRKGLLLLPIMFLFPLFPDDLLCFIAGASEMTWKYFITVTLITRPIGIFCTCYFLGGVIIPFSGWGIPVWIVIGIFLVVACIFLFKYQEKITNWIIDKFGKKKTDDSTLNNPKDETIDNNNTQENTSDNQNNVSISKEQVVNTQYEISKEPSQTSTKQNKVKTKKKNSNNTTKKKVTK